MRAVKAIHSTTISKMDFISRNFVMDHSMPNVYASKLRSLTWVVCMVLLVLIATDSKAGIGSVAQPRPLPELTAIGVESSYEDLRVSAYGADVVITRDFTERAWHWNRRWAAAGVSKGGPAGGIGREQWLLPLTTGTFQKGAFITRNGAKFFKTSSYDVSRLEDVIFVSDNSSSYETFGVLERGLIWRDRSGNWIEYYVDEEITHKAMVRRYGNEKYSHTLKYDDQTRISEVIDHFGNTLVTFSYLDRSRNPSKIQDYQGRSVEYKYDDEGQLVEFIDARGQSWTYGYTEEFVNKKSRIAFIEDPLGNRVTYEYTNNSTTQTDADGHKTVYNYRYDSGASRIIRTDELPDGTIKETIKDNSSKFGSRAKFQSFVNGELVSQRFGDWDDYEIENELGERTRYKKNSFKKLETTTYPDGSTEKWSYSSDGRYLTSHTNRNGIRTEWQYDGLGRLTETREATGTPEQAVVRYAYPNELTRVTTYVGDAYTSEAIITEHFDQFGNVIERTDAEGHTYNYTYNAQGQVLTETKPSGAVYTYEYDPAGNLTKHTDPLGRVTSYTYDAAGNMATVTWPNGAVTTYSYNALNEQVGVTNAKNQTVTTEYDRETRTFRFKDARDATTEVALSPKGLPKQIKDPNGNQIVQHYEAGRLTSTQYPTFEQTFVYGTGSKLESITDQYDGKQSTTQVQVDPLGQVTQQIDANSNTEQREYDALGRLTQIIDALGGITKLTYDTHGNLIRVTDPEGRETAFEYNTNNQVVAEERSPEAGQVSRRTYSYDANGNLSTEITPNGEKVTYSYNDADELTQIQFFATEGETVPSQTVTLGYNDLGQLTSYNDGETSGSYTYDELGQLLTATTDYGPFAKSISYTYDAAGNIATYTNPEDVTYAYSYDSNGQVKSVDIPGVGLISFSNYEWTQPTQINLPGGSVIQRQYDGLQRMKSNTLLDPAQSSLMEVLYGYDSVGNVRTQTKKDGEYAYVYDELYRLTSADYPTSDDETFGYDGVGNRTSYNGDDSWQYNQANQLTEKSDTSYQYNANGHMAQKTVAGETTYYFYNNQERLVRVEDTNNQVIAEYGYNPFGHRLWKEVGGQRTYFFYNDSGLVGEYTSTGELIKEYQYTANSTWMTSPLFQRDSDNVYFYQNDHLGTPHRMVTSSGEVVWEATYKAFGALGNLEKSASNNLRFPGQYYDTETGLQHNYFRDYDPGLGRYFQSDPIGLRGGRNLYSYGLQNPLFYSDPDGKSSIVIRPYIPVTRPTFEMMVPKTRPLPREFHVPVDPNQPPRFPRNRKCQLDYWADKLSCNVSCENNFFSRAICKAKAWYKWKKCERRDDDPPDGLPKNPDNDFPDFPEPGYWDIPMAGINEIRYEGGYV